jgi:hypothetical protein
MPQAVEKVSVGCAPCTVVNNSWWMLPNFPLMIIVRPGQCERPQKGHAPTAGNAKPPASFDVLQKDCIMIEY